MEALMESDQHVLGRREKRIMTEERKHSHSRRGRILCVDPNLDNGSMMSYLLHFEGYECVSVENLELGFQFALTEAFDLYLLDLWYEDGSGIQLCKAIRELDPNVPILFFSAWALKSERAQAMDAGADAYILKPELENLRREIAWRLKGATEHRGLTTSSSALPHNVV